MEKAGGSIEAERSGSWSRLAVSVELEVGGQVIGQHVMLLGAFLGGVAEETPGSLRPRRVRCR